MKPEKVEVTRWVAAKDNSAAMDKMLKINAMTDELPKLKSQEKPEVLLEAEQLLREAVLWGLESPEDLAELSELTKGPVTPETVNALARLAGRVQALKALRGDPGAVARIASYAKAEMLKINAMTDDLPKLFAQAPELGDKFVALARQRTLQSFSVLGGSFARRALRGFALSAGVGGVLIGGTVGHYAAGVGALMALDVGNRLLSKGVAMALENPSAFRTEEQTKDRRDGALTRVAANMRQHAELKYDLVGMLAGFVVLGYLLATEGWHPTHDPLWLAIGIGTIALWVCALWHDYRGGGPVEHGKRMQVRIDEWERKRRAAQQAEDGRSAPEALKGVGLPRG